MNKSVNNKQGFTFIELMLVIALLGIFLGIVYGFLNYNLTFLNQRNQEQQTYQQARIAMYRITNLVRQYERVQIKGNGIYEWVLSEEKGDLGEENKLINFNKNTNHPKDCQLYYYCASDKQFGEIRDSSHNVVAEGIKTLNFTYQQPDDQPQGLMRITIAAVDVNSPNSNEVVLTTIVRLDRSYQY